MRVRGARTTAAQVEPIVVSTPLSNAKQRFQGMADFAPRAIRIALLSLYAGSTRGNMPQRNDELGVGSSHDRPEI